MGNLDAPNRERRTFILPQNGLYLNRYASQTTWLRQTFLNGSWSSTQRVLSFSSFIGRIWVTLYVPESIADESPQYDDHQYVKRAKLIAEDSRVKSIGLVNFDTQHMNEIIERGLKVVTNQVQVPFLSHIIIWYLRVDRLIVLVLLNWPSANLRNGEYAENVTWSSWPMNHLWGIRSFFFLRLADYEWCGGFLADKWLGSSVPDLFDVHMTPSHRKVLRILHNSLPLSEFCCCTVSRNDWDLGWMGSLSRTAV
jgi:hypothetical protein